MTKASTKTASETKAVEFNAEATNKFEFEVRGDDGLRYDTAHKFGPLSDERYLQWFNEFEIKGSGDDVKEEAREASVRLWDDLIIDVENISFPDGTDWKPLIDPSEKIESLNKLLAVAAHEPEEKESRVRDLGAASDTVTVETEAWFNGEVTVQKHILTKKTLEFQKKYSRIQARRFKQEKIGGLRKKPKIEYVPQDSKIGELYDEMCVRRSGFVGDVVPLRFKTFVMHYVFDETVSEKK